jgi:hypothetical protein
MACEGVALISVPHFTEGFEKRKRASPVGSDNSTRVERDPGCDPSAASCCSQDCLAAWLFLLQMQHALLGVDIHAEIAQEVEAEQAGNS